MKQPMKPFFGPNSEVSLLTMILRLSSLAVPRSKRSDWLNEWQAELCERLTLPPSQRGSLFQIGSLARGIASDAAFLRLDSLRASYLANSSKGAARWCLQLLAVPSFACLILERLLTGSWHIFRDAVASHFFGYFVYVLLPGIAIALSTSPTRPRKCDRKRSQLTGILSANARWNLFLGAKVLLTLTWGFLLSAVVASAAYKIIGHWADWVELLATALILILSLRWALLDQELRCQHCLRILTQPTRVGYASRNFLDWNGTELICVEGHGLLHITQMQGSWCWYDLWVELDPTWNGLFSA